MRDKVTRQGPQTTLFFVFCFSFFFSVFFHALRIDAVHRVKDWWFRSNDLSFKTSNDARRLMARDVSYNQPGGLPYLSHFKFEAHKKAHTHSNNKNNNKTNKQQQKKKKKKKKNPSNNNESLFSITIDRSTKWSLQMKIFAHFLPFHANTNSKHTHNKKLNKTNKQKTQQEQQKSLFYND